MALGPREGAEVVAVMATEVTAQVQRLQGEPSNSSETGFGGSTLAPWLSQTIMSPAV